MSALLNQSLKLTAGALRTRLRVDKLSLRAKKIDIFMSRRNSDASSRVRSLPT